MEHQEQDPQGSVRINVQLSGEAYEALLLMAGGERKMGRWLTRSLLFLYRYEISQNAVESLAEAKEFLDQWFGMERAGE